MKLRYTPRSPFVRKVRVTAIETGLDGQIELVATNLADPPAELSDDNPLGKVPTLITDDGEPLFDSPVICEYLDSLHDGDKLFPPAGKARWTALRRQALADGILEATTARRHELLRPEEERSAAFIKKQKIKAERGLDAVEKEAGALGGEVTIGHIAIGCVLGYLAFRFPDEPWRLTRPDLRRWYQDFAARRSMTETAPQDH
jgi:glutathione S-transferase